MQFDPLWLGLAGMIGIAGILIAILSTQVRRRRAAANERLRLAMTITPAARAVLRVDARSAGGREVVLGAEIVLAAAALTGASYLFAHASASATYWAFGGLGVYGAYRVLRGLSVFVGPGERAIELAAERAQQAILAPARQPSPTAVLDSSATPIRLLSQPAERADTTWPVEGGVVLDVIGEYGEFVHVRTADKLDGWVRRSQLRQPP